ncbi:hypothetical protein HPB51_026272 [Rhipicephalus microplus]|uniref:Uncharacterized protein n=1 Tax=Rhipicephalus microplus TaxID=6941 RepID=A0A9J6D7X8_RHIMP|nr:hypothetical protein HPB51_026272 [Rhipicephalus microplus]
MLNRFHPTLYPSYCPFCGSVPTVYHSTWEFSAPQGVPPIPNPTPSSWESALLSLRRQEQQQLVQRARRGYRDGFMLSYSRHQVSAAHEAIISGDQAKLEELAASDAQLLRARSDLGCHPIHAAIEARNLEAAKLILDAFPAAINLKAPHGRNPLHLAALRRDDDMYKFLVDSGADPKALDQKGKTAEYYLKNSRKRRSRSTASVYDTSLERSSSVRDTKPAIIDTAARSTELETITVPADKGALGAAGDGVVSHGDKSAEGTAGVANAAAERGDEATEATGDNESGQSGSSDGGGKDHDSPALASAGSDVAAAKDVSGATLEAVNDGRAPISEAAGAVSKEGRSDQEDTQGACAVDASSTSFSSSSSDSPPTVTAVSSDDGGARRETHPGLGKEGQGSSDDARTDVTEIVGAGVESGGENGEDAENLESREQCSTGMTDESMVPSSENAVSETKANDAEVNDNDARKGQHGDEDLRRAGQFKEIDKSELSQGTCNKSNTENKSNGGSQTSKSLSKVTDESESFKKGECLNKLQGAVEDVALSHAIKNVDLAQDSKRGVEHGLESAEVVLPDKKDGAHAAANNAGISHDPENNANGCDDLNAENLMKESPTRRSSSGGKCHNSAGGEKPKTDTRTQSDGDKNQASEIIRDQRASDPNGEKDDFLSEHLSPDGAFSPVETGALQSMPEATRETNISQNAGVSEHSPKTRAEIEKSEHADQVTDAEVTTRSNDTTPVHDPSGDDVIVHCKSIKERPKAFASSEAGTGDIEDRAVKVDGVDFKNPKDSNGSEDRIPLEAVKLSGQPVKESTDKPPSSKADKRLVREQKLVAKPGGAKDTSNGKPNPRRSSSMASMKTHLTKSMSRHSLNTEEKDGSRNNKQSSLETRKTGSSQNKTLRTNSAATLATDKSPTGEQRKGDQNGTRAAVEDPDGKATNMKSRNESSQGNVEVPHKLSANEPDREGARKVTKEREHETAQTERKTRDSSASQSQKSLGVAIFDTTQEEMLRTQGSVDKPSANEGVTTTHVCEGLEETTSSDKQNEASKQRSVDTQSSDEAPGASQKHKCAIGDEGASSGMTEGQGGSRELLKEPVAVPESLVAPASAEPSKPMAPKEHVHVDTDNALEKAGNSNPQPLETSQAREPRRRSAEKVPNNKGSKVSSNTSAQLGEYAYSVRS